MTLLGSIQTLCKVTIPICGAALASLYYFQSLLIYPSLIDGARGHCSEPLDHGWAFENVKLTTDDGEVLQCWALKRSPDDPAYSNKTVLILMPNAGNIGHAMPRIDILHNTLHHNVVIYLYRGYGKSTGTALELGLKKDAQRVMRFIADDKQLLSLLLVLHGQLLGGAVAIYIAATMPDMVSGMIIENTFLSIPKTVPHMFPFLAPFTLFVNQIWDLESLVPTIPAGIPVLLMSSRMDEIVPPLHMDTIYTLLESDDKEIVLFEECTHNDAAGSKKYWDKVAWFIRSKIEPSGK